MVNGLARVVYFSGPSGTGKTTLIKHLIEQFPGKYIPGNPEKLDRETHVRDKMRKFSTIYDYAIDKIQQRLKEAEYHDILSENNPSAIILGDRCICDTESYILAAEKNKDLTEKEVKSLIEYQAKIHPEHLVPNHVVFLDSSVDDIIKYLSMRATVEGKGTENMERQYLEFVSESFRNHFSTKRKDAFRLLVPDSEATKKINSWIKENVNHM
jgi:deoxyadenosine/deoxycytidine kinase